MTTKRERSSYYKKWAEENREKLRANQARYASKHPERIKAANGRWYSKTAAAQRDREYGLALGQFDEMSAACEGKCNICQKVPSGTGRRGKLHVDHCHETKVVRGLLCFKCNLGIGLLGDDPENLRRGAEYLSKRTKSHGG